MKFVAAYLLAVLAGKSSPSAEDLTAILESGNFHPAATHPTDSSCYYSLHSKL
jgi:ribosomal protein L12E/L44/L45/RPP1/RPP2